MRKMTFTGKVLMIVALAAVALLLPQTVRSRTVSYTQDKIGYKLNTSTNEATVTDLRHVYDDIEVPDSVVYENTVYRVTAIGFQAGYQNSKAKTIQLGKYVVLIDSCAFTGNSSLTAINIPICVKKIGGIAFQNCSKLDTVALPEGLEYIGASAFSYTGLKTLHIPSSVKHLGYNPILGSSKLKTITVAAANPSFKLVDGAVCTMDGKRLLFVPKTLAAESYTIPGGVASVAPYAMYGGTTIKGLIIPASVATVGEYAFYNMGIKTLSIGSGLKKFGEHTFSSCSKLVQITVDPANPDFKSMGNNILSKDGKNLLMVIVQEGEYSVPTGVENIGPYVFEGMTKMTGINLNGVRTIGEAAFYNTSNLSAVNWGTVLDTIGRMAFQNSGITSVVLPPSVRSIQFQAFNNCKKNTNLVLSEGLSEIATSAFLGNKLIKEVKLPSTVKTMGNAIFERCDSLRKAILPDNMMVIPSKIFNRCKALKEVNWPAALREIGEYAFAQCPITNAALPSTVETIGKAALEDTKIGPDITLPPLITVIDQYVFTGCNEMNSFTASPGLKEIKNAGIQGCHYVTAINLNEGLEIIGRIGLASNIRLKTLTIPSTVLQIDSNFLIENYQQTDLVMLPSNPPTTNGNVVGKFKQNGQTVYQYEKITLHVLAGSVEAYKQHPIWGKFKNIVGDAHQGVNTESMDEPTVIEIYDITGRRLREKVPGAVNILRMSDGSVMKVMVPSDR